MTIDAPTGVPDIIPTHSCFDDVIEFLVAANVHPVAAPLYRVVHGVCRGHAVGTQYAHAWVEQAHARVGDGTRVNVAWQSGVARATGELLFFALPLPAFRELYAVQRQSNYPLALWWEAYRRSGYPGPWRDEYVALCNDAGGRVVGMMRGVKPVAFVHTNKLYDDVERDRDVHCQR